MGASLSLTGDFSADGQAFERGYELWVNDVNARGGILGRKVTLKILNDNSSPTQVATNYQTLFASDHVDLAFGPFSSLLTTPSASVAAHYGYALVEGAGGAPTVFNSPANMADHNVFDVSLPIQDEMVPFVNWIASMPASQRPKTAAYPMADDPFATPPVQLAQKELQALGVKTVYSQIFPEEVADYKAPADQVAATGAQIVVLGSTDVLAGTLSYGQRKLLELAYVLVADPAVILLDEPAGGVNLSLVNQIADRIRELNAAGKTFLIVEHNMEFVMGLCDRVTVLDSGTVVAAGPPDIVRTDRRVLDAYLGEDFGASQDDPGEAHDGVAR